MSKVNSEVDRLIESVRTSEDQDVTSLVSQFSSTYVQIFLFVGGSKCNSTVGTHSNHKNSSKELLRKVLEIPRARD